MNKKILYFFVILFLISSCKKNNSDTGTTTTSISASDYPSLIVGKWKQGTKLTVYFNASGTETSRQTGIVINASGTYYVYSVSGISITVNTQSGGSNLQSATYSFINSNKTIKVVDGLGSHNEDLTFTDNNTMVQTYTTLSAGTNPFVSQTDAITYTRQ
ncbi:hypothetical protein BDD43_5256 [Mucilaginibacter gracilis]|uniref:Lipocalin-like protein n=1 Tax=Mucilaginibacter gracilis TaxID=423350 RepID=A0A495J7N2_9SPHI|nr:hypothetical protein [Mucilaginibacter gracilis]RKR85000.1 hypothetical protein BDD43_5256 [Mucilaginibacter gracilis]